jgi:hypothetical protein
MGERQAALEDQDGHEYAEGQHDEPAKSAHERTFQLD